MHHLMWNSKVMMSKISFSCLQSREHIWLLSNVFIFINDVVVQVLQWRLWRFCRKEVATVCGASLGGRTNESQPVLQHLRIHDCKNTHMQMNVRAHAHKSSHTIQWLLACRFPGWKIYPCILIHKCRKIAGFIWCSCLLMLPLLLI